MAKSSLSLGTKVWADKINGAWRKGFDAIIETGRHLIEAKKNCAHGDFADLVENRLAFKPRVAQSLMKIAGDERITNAKHASLMPASWTVLNELTKLDDEAFERALTEGEITPATKRREAAKLAAPTVIDVEHEDITESPLTALSAGVSGGLQAPDEDAVPVEPNPNPARANAADEPDDGARVVAGLQDAVAFARGDTSKVDRVTYVIDPAVPQQRADLAMSLIRGLDNEGFTGADWARGHEGDFTQEDVNRNYNWTTDAADEFERIESGVAA